MTSYTTRPEILEPNGGTEGDPLDDWCQYDDSDDFYTTCINRTHLAEGRACALPNDLEMASRLVDLDNVLGLVLDQLKAQAEHLPPEAGRIKARLVRQLVAGARDQIQQAHRLQVADHPTNRSTR